MPRFDDIYEIAADNYGLVTFAEAQEVGVTSVELRRFVKDGRLERLGHGVYKITRYIPTPLDHYAEATALVGPGSYIHGESVLAMHNLGLANPEKTNVAIVKRTRKKLPGWIRLVTGNSGDGVTSYEGIPSQSVAEALRFCRGRVMKERLVDAVHDALRAGLISEEEKRSLEEELELRQWPNNRTAGEIST
ncbi:type IV toxin-antitoxin system AbiEi family antitoxin domain-containing protein [Arabiibacter massiliensis]|uniref:type IV toxin-antitoxin system AbiEi family antitoxin domain-containing protein n=1 Tax=Arabiibacter massiliensis TaxID=1870985 RepID=UPI0009B9924D|nr:type IV toxin-antitoxin system AbiEi family antitoxin domain-containing protein [Arabiibacter massiliensis]